MEVYCQGLRGGVHPKLISIPRKELQYMLHNRRKAEIEVLSACGEGMQSQRGLALDIISLAGSVVCEQGDSLKGKPPIHTCCSALPTSLQPSVFTNIVSETKCTPHGLLIRYLTTKICACVAAAADQKTDN